MELKNYQKKCLQLLQQYLQEATFYGAREAFERLRKQSTRAVLKSRRAVFQPIDGLENVPYVCLRLPTGGGKTLLCAHSIGLAAQSYLQRERPLCLWLVPSKTIKRQTLETLRDPKHFNNHALFQAFGERFRVFDISDFVNIRPQDLHNYACIVVATFASSRIDKEKTEERKVYDHHEELEGHFARINPGTPNLERTESGQIKYSFINLLHVQRPLVLVDEAHNAKSDLSQEMLQRIHPAAIIEYTATPAKNSNLIESVSAQDLKDEQMIKLPIQLQAHANWQQAVTASIQTRARLEQLAARDKDYIRPLVLFQAENKNSEATIAALKHYLCTEEKIPEEQIAIATGEQRELDAINLFDPYCSIRYVLTVQALKEGWDCSFAYVLCSVASTRSLTAVEQLLGRVLRMPYARARHLPELNQAYAHVSAESWPLAVSQMADRLVSMGFEQQEAQRYIDVQAEFAEAESDWPKGSLFAQEAAAAAFTVPLTHAPNLCVLDSAEQSKVEVREEAGHYVLKVKSADTALLEKLEQAAHIKDRRELSLRAASWLRQRPHKAAPAEQGELFTVPQLCLLQDGVALTLEAEHCLDFAGWNPLGDYRPIGTDEFCADEKGEVWLVDIQQEKLSIRRSELEQQLPLDSIPTDLTVEDMALGMAQKFAAKLPACFMAEGSLLHYLQKALQDLLWRKDMNLPSLIRARALVEKVLENRLLAARNNAYKKAFQKQLLKGSDTIAVSAEQVFRFPRDYYPAASLYEGNKTFEHHYYRAIAAMNQEEEACALELDGLFPHIKYWVRNLERQPHAAFWLPTATDRFYPDFVAQLAGGRILAVEYKGAHLDNEDTREKALVGKLWAEKSGNIFLVAWKQDKKGRNLAAQLRAALQG